MAKHKILTLIFALGAIGLASLSRTTPVAATDAEPVVNIWFGKQVGTTDLKPVGSLYSSANFYVPVDISVYNVGAYYVSVFYDCSDPNLTGVNLEKCQQGNLLTENGDTIASVSDSKTFSTMQNEWGFRYNLGTEVVDLTDRSFTAIPTTKDDGWVEINGENEFRANGTVGDDHKVLTLGFGAKINGDTASGTYKGKVAVAVVATPTQLVTWDDVISSRTTMQDFYRSQCDRISYGEEGALKDERDNKVYKVAKLRDGNCWMIQNLALAGGTTITSSKSDVKSSYTLPASYYGNFNSDTEPNMYDGTHQDNTYDTDGDGNNSGAYYNWPTAIANNGGDEINGGYGDEVDVSICPKRWQLPSTDQFKKLFAAYKDGVDLNTNWHAGYLGDFIGDEVWYSGTVGSWWTRTVYHENDAYIANIYEGRPGPSYNSARANGYAVRCVFSHRY